jgi:DNA polymerase-3 subunit beta
LEVKYKGKNIYDVLDMTVEEALEFFKDLPRIARKLQTLWDVGLNYIKLGQAATTLSGGEAQRVKLATELSRQSTGKTVYILDEPTTGLHSADVHRLIDVLQAFVDKGNTVIVSDATEFTIMGIDAADYPEMPAVNDGVGLTLPQNLLRSMIRQTLFAVAQTNVRPIQTGVLFLLKDCLLQLVAVDGQRLAMRSEKVESTGEMNFVVPGKTLSEVLKLLEDEDSSMTMAVGRRHIVMEIGGYAVISRLLDGEFIPYQRAIPQNITTTVRVNTRSFIDSVDRAALVTNDRLKAPLVCTFSDNKVRVYCSTPLGRVNDALSATIEGKEEEMGFNSRFLLDALRNTEADEVRVELAGALQPMKILPVSGDNFLFLVLPVRLPNHNRNV